MTDDHDAAPARRTSVPTMKVRVPRDADAVHRGTLSIGSWTVSAWSAARPVPAAEKREGDGRTPIGIFPLRYGFHDPVERPGFGAGTVFPFVPMSGDMIWEEDPLDPHYNRLVFAQHGARPGDRLARTGRTAGSTSSSPSATTMPLPNPIAAARFSSMRHAATAPARPAASPSPVSKWRNWRGVSPSGW